MEAIKLCRLDTPIIFIEARINLSRFVVTGCAAKTDRKSGSAGMPRPISYAVFCLKKKEQTEYYCTHGYYVYNPCRIQYSYSQVYFCGRVSSWASPKLSA